MKNSLLLLAGFAALSLASCSKTSTTDTTTTTGTPTDSTATATTTTTTSDEVYHTRGNRMADKFANDMKITDAAMREKLRTAYYNRSKRYGMMKEKYGSDTTGMGAAMRQYNTDTDAEFQSVITDPTQYKSYQSSRSTYDESSNMDQADQGAATGSGTSSDNSATNTSTSGDMSNGSASGSTGSGSSTDMSTSGGSDMSASGSGVEKSKSKMSDGSKVKVKTDGTVKMKDGDGNKAKM